MSIDLTPHFANVSKEVVESALHRLSTAASKYGIPDWARTSDLQLSGPTLFQLSYGDVKGLDAANVQPFQFHQFTDAGHPSVLGGCWGT